MINAVTDVPKMPKRIHQGQHGLGACPLLETIQILQALQSIQTLQALQTWQGLMVEPAAHSGNLWAPMGTP